MIDVFDRKKAPTIASAQRLACDHNCIPCSKWFRSGWVCCRCNRWFSPLPDREDHLSVIERAMRSRGLNPAKDEVPDDLWPAAVSAEMANRGLAR